VVFVVVSATAAVVVVGQVYEGIIHRVIANRKHAIKFFFV
jgi:hypothetical protein